MLKFIWLILMGFLIIGIIFMGDVIFKTVSETSEDMKRLQSQVKEKARDLKNDAIEKKEALHETLKGVRESLGQQKEPQTEKAEPADMVRDKPAAPKATEDAEPGLDMSPLDEEDRKLTAEIIGGGSGLEKGVEKVKQNKQKAEIGATDEEDSQARKEVPETFGSDRLAAIREVYRQAIETLDFK